MTVWCTIPTLRVLVTVWGVSIMPRSSTQVVAVHSPCEDGHAGRRRERCQRVGRRPARLGDCPASEPAVANHPRRLREDLERQQITRSGSSRSSPRLLLSRHSPGGSGKRKETQIVQSCKTLEDFLPEIGRQAIRQRGGSPSTSCQRDLRG